MSRDALHFGCFIGGALIKTFANKETELLFAAGKAKRLPADVLARAIRKLDMVDSAYEIGDLRVPPGNKFHALQGDRKGQYAIAVNDQWRICFRFEGNDAYDVEICDYH